MTLSTDTAPKATGFASASGRVKVATETQAFYLNKSSLGKPPQENTGKAIGIPFCSGSTR